MNTNFDKVSDRILETFPIITLNEMDNASKLMQRCDTKFVFSIGLLPNLLKECSENYRILDICGITKQQYETIYYDTENLDMYYLHHNCRPSRYKVRIRNYVQSNLKFFEVKIKNNKGVTNKKRIPFDANETLQSGKSNSFLAKNTPYQVAEIDSKLKNYFTRITLVGISTAERVTLDYNLSFSDCINSNSISTPNICVAEIKRDKAAAKSKLTQVLKNNKIYPMGFSKYCMGMAILNKDLKSNAFKDRLLKISKIESNIIKLNNNGTIWNCFN